MMNNKPKKPIPGYKNTNSIHKPTKSKGEMDINAFIANEMKNLKMMNKTDLPKPLINPETEKSKNELLDSMKGRNLNELIKRDASEDILNSSATKFKGFSETTKFNETSSSNQGNSSVKQDLRASSSKGSINKPEPFVTRFPETKQKNEQAQQIIESLIKNENKKVTPNIEIKPKEISASTIIDKNDPYILPTGKMYQSELQRVDDPDDIPEDYDDFIDVNEMKKIEEEKKERFRKEKELKNQMEKERLRKEQEIKLQMASAPLQKNKRDEVRVRVNDLKNIITLEGEIIDFFGFDFVKENGGNSKSSNFKEEIGICTDPIKTKDSSTATDDDKTFTQNTKESSKSPQENDAKIKAEQSLAIINKEDNTKSNIEFNYQPLTYEAYQFFIHIGPFIENVLLNNINKYILQSKSEQAGENTGMTKLDKEFIFPDELISYLFPNKKPSDINFHYTSFQFFDTKPYQIAFAITLSLPSASLLNALFHNSNDSCNLIVIYCLFSNQIKKIYFSFARINEMSLFGESENILITSKADGTFDIFDLRNTDKETYYTNYENNNMVSIARLEDNNQRAIIGHPKYELVLPEFSSTNSFFSFNSPITSMQKKVIESLSTEKVFKMAAIDQEGIFAMFNIRESSLNAKREIDQLLIKPDILLNLSNGIKRVFNADDTIQVTCNEFKFYEENKENELFFLLTNLGLAKVKIEGKEHFIAEQVYNSSLNKMTSFDIADTGHICASFTDYTVKVYDSKFDTIYTSFVPNLIKGAVLEKTIWSNVICKNAKGKLVRNSLLANFYIFTTKNEFIIFDLNQKNPADLKKVKRKKDLGSKNNLSRKNSQIAMSDSLFTDYSNFILQTNSIEHKVEIHKLSLRKQYFEATNIIRANDKILEKIFKSNQ